MREQNKSKKIKRNFEKVLDKLKEMWYNEWVASQEQRIQKESEPWKLNNEIVYQEELN